MNSVLKTPSPRRSPSAIAHLLRGEGARRLLSAFLVSLLAAGTLSFLASPARAISVDASAAAFDFHFGTNGTLLSGANSLADGAVVKYAGITGTPLSGISVDAIVTTDLTSSNVSTYDNPGGASSNDAYFQIDGGVTAGGDMAFNFEFYEAGTYTGVGTGTPVTLNNVSITSIDLDGTGTPAFCQFTDFTGFQDYYLGASSNVDVLTNADDATIPVGVTRFIAGLCTSRDNDVADAVQVQYDAVTKFTVKFGSDITSGNGFFGIAFKPLSAVFGVTQPTGVENPANQPPTSSNETRSVTTGQPSVLQLADFGDFQDPDNNPFEKVKITALPGSGSLQKFVGGSWVSVDLNDEILVSNILNGNLRFTGSADTLLRFKVSDGGTSYSSSAYALTLLVSEQSQSITFNNPGTKTPGSPQFASGATASSGLPVSLTSLTPGVCTVSGLNITPVSSGTCTIVASQAGNDTYSSATSVTQTFPISSLQPQTITAPNPGSKIYDGGPSTFTVSPTASSNLTVSLFSLNTSVCTASGFEITIVGPGNCTIRNAQAGNVTYATAPPVEYTFAVGTPVVDYTIFYDGNENSAGDIPDDQTGNGSVTLASNTGDLERAGYTFMGWNTEPDGSGTRYLESSGYELLEDVFLYADWAPISAELAATGASDTHTVSLAAVAGVMALAGVALVARRRFVKA
jgi:hypothetical protein